MKPFIAVSALAATAMAAPAGPVHPAVGDLVATVRGYRPVSLEGFSEDDNQDGFVDPVGQVAPVAYAHPIPAVAPAPYFHHAPITYAAAPLTAAVTEVKVEAPKVEKVELPAPVITYAAAPAFHHAAPLVHAAPALHTYTHTVPVAQTYTHTVPAGVHRQVYTTHHVGPLAGVVVPGVVPAAAEAEVTEE